MLDGRAAYDFGARSSGEAHGVVLTKPHIVSLILDLAGYVPDADLPSMRLLEPSCGQGAFLVQAVERLLVSAARRGMHPKTLEGAISAYDVDAAQVDHSRNAVIETLLAGGVKRALALKLAKRWVRCADFLLTPLTAAFDCIVGNPPYVRVEQIAPELQTEYRRRFASIFDRADLYVAFIERGLSLLSKHGVLSFICADRWVRNRYGAPLRALLEAMPSWRMWPLYETAPLAGAQGMARGRIALLGDAAHPMRPYLAQGAGMALEDAAELGRMLAMGREAGLAVETAMQRYALHRWERCARVQARSRRNGVIFHASGPLRMARDAAMRIAEDQHATLRVTGPPQSLRVTMTIESPLHYFDEAPLVRARAGDRELAASTITADKTWTFDVPADALAASGGAITIETDKTFVPAERGSGADHRRLGLRVFAISVANSLTAAENPR